MNEETTPKYILKQEKPDIVIDKPGVKEDEDPFKGHSSSTANIPLGISKRGKDEVT